MPPPNLNSLPTPQYMPHPSSSLLSENSRPYSSDGSSSSSASPPSPRLLLHHRTRKAPHPRADESEDGYSSHPSIYSASPVGSESNHVTGCQGQEAAAKVDGIFEQDVEDPPREGLTERNRNYSSFSGLSMLDTISERKSASPRSVLHDDEEEEGEEEDGFMLDSSDEEYAYAYGRSFYYEYASPTQPLHPARSQSVPPRDINPLPASQSFHQPSSVPAIHTFFSRSPTRSPQQHHSPPRLSPQRQAFRPPTSAHRSYGALMAHPFHRAPLAERGSAAVGEHTPDELESPVGGSAVGGESGWGRFVRGCCLLCCCVVIAEEDRRL